MELYLIIHSGISVGEGLLLLAEDEKDEACRAALSSLCQRLDEGENVSEAFRSAGAFPDYMVRMIEIGENTGYLEAVFKALSEYYDRQVSISRSIRSAVVYPAILFVMMLAVIAVLVIEVLPIFSDVFAQLGSSMSPVAMAFMRFGMFLRDARWVFLGVVVVLAALIAAVRFVPACAKLWRSFTGSVSMRTRLGRQISAARFASAMAMTLSSGLDPDASLEMSQHLTDGSAMSGKVQKCRDMISSGESFADSISANELFSPVYCRMLSIGVRTGAADTVMSEIARRSEVDVSVGIERTIGRVEPVLVVIMSLLVGLVLLSVMLPLMGIMSSIG